MAIEMGGIPVRQTVEGASPGAGDSHKKLEAAASQFEALLVAQMLRHMRESGEGGWMGTGDDQAGERMVEMAEEQLAQALSAQGGLGLASLAVNNISK